MQRIFIGDVQGCALELNQLISRAESQFGSEFALWVAGDLVNRGPDNRRALELVRSFVEAGRGQYVLGNHELNLLAVDFGLRELGPNDSIEDILCGNDAAEWTDWLRHRPLVAPGQIDDQRFVMLHASASPDWTYEDVVAHGRSAGERLAASREAASEFLAMDPSTDPVRDALGRLTRCRSVTTDGGWSSEEPDAEPGEPKLAWHSLWMDRAHDYGVIYGHWARQGLHIDKGLRGLDTGCVHHGRGRDGFLTAWLPESNPTPAGSQPFDLPDDRFWQIPARQRYYNPLPT